MPEVSFGLKPVTTTQGETLKAAGAPESELREESGRDKKKLRC